MTSEEKSKISDLNKCNFTEMAEFFKAQSEARKQMTKEEKLVSRRLDPFNKSTNTKQKNSAHLHVATPTNLHKR